MDLVMTTVDECMLAIAPRDALGRPAPVQNPAWLVENSEVLSATISPDGLSCAIAALGPVTAGVLVTVKADVDLGDGVRERSGTLNVIVNPAQAETIEIVPGPVTPQVP